MTKLFPLILLNLVSIFVSAQTIQGYVTDSATKEKLPYANITLTSRNFGTTTNSEGVFTLTLDRYTETDSLLISFIGYQPQKIAVPSSVGREDLVIALQPANETLAEVVVSGKKIAYEHSEITMGTTKKKRTFSSSVPFGYEVALRIENPDRRLGRLTALTLKFKKRKEGDYEMYPAYYRLSFYEVAINGAPGKYLSAENVMLTPDNKKTITLDLETYAIPFSRRGVFVGIETVNPEGVQPKSSMYVTTPTLLYTHTKTPLLYTRFRGKRWTKQKNTSVFKNKLYQVPYVKVKVQFQK